MAPNLKLQTAIYGAREISHVTPRQLHVVIVTHWWSGATHVTYYIIKAKI